MVHVFVESYDLTVDYLKAALKKHIGPGSRVCVVAFSFRDSQVRDSAEWDALYSCAKGRYYGGIVQPLLTYGVAEEDVTFVNYYADTPESAAEKVRQADVLYFLGGLMDKTVERIDEFGLQDVILSHRGVLMGYSAGALIQLAEYHVSPDGDYPEFVYLPGLPLLKDFYLEVHYEGNPVQRACIARVLRERRKPVYATADEQGAIIIDENGMQLLGNVTVFSPEEAMA